MKYTVVAHPYATQYGTIDVPDNVPEEEVDSYIETYWNKIEFGKLDLDYAGTDFEREKEDND